MKKLDFNKINLETISEKENAEIEAKEKKERYRNAKDIFISYSNVPEKYIGADFRLICGEYKQIIVLNNFVILKGKLGRGKTYTSVAFLKYIYFNKNIIGHFIRCHTLPTMEIKELKKYINSLIYKNLIVLDDIFFIKSNKFVLELIGSLILGRIENDKKTIITINENLEDLFDNRIVDKMKEEFKTIEFDGKNRRKNK